MNIVEKAAVVTEELIRENNYGSPWRCPMAEAIKKLLKPEYRDSVGVDPEEVEFYQGHYSLGQPVYTHKLDKSYGVDQVMRNGPFTFQITIPDYMLL